MLDNRIIALYERLSIEDADVKRNDAKSESNSIAHQRRLLFSFIEQQPDMAGMRVVEYKDDGYSGTNFNRPKFIELMSEVRKGAVAIIIVRYFRCMEFVLLQLTIVMIAIRILDRRQAWM